MRNIYSISIITFGALFFGLLLSACGGSSATVTPTPRDDSAIRAALTSGAHDDTYDLGQGPNTYCAQCKSPANWDPEAVIDAPPNCVSCKFSSDTQMRIAEGNPLVPETDWRGIRCENCHPVTESGEVDKSIAWWSPVTKEYVSMEDSTALCEQCHRDSEAGTLRRRALSESDAHADATCTTCHDAHSVEADCADCHNEEDSETDFVAACWMLYLAPDAEARHGDVRCEACHDNAGFEALPVDDPDEPYLGQWATWRITLIAGSIPSNHVWVSHNLTREVECSRCHFSDNPWSLDVEVRPQ